MPASRTQLSASSVNGVVYAIGGYNGGGYFATVQAYDPTSDTWSIKTSMPTGRNGLSTSVVNGIIYAVGGGVGGVLGTVEAYDPASDTWTTKASMPTPRELLSTSVVNGLIYAVGGTTNTSSVGTVEAYNPATDTWTTKASMPTGRNGLSTSVVNGIIYAVGGSGNAVFGTVEAYDAATDTWTTKAPMPTARTGLGTSVVNGVIYAVGGVNGSGFLGTVEVYDPATDTWTTGPSMPTARYFFGTSVAQGVIYGMGGNNVNGGSYGLATNEAFTPPCNYQMVSTDTAGNFGFTSPVLNPGYGALPNINSASVNQAIPLQVTVKDCYGNPATNLTLAPPIGTGTVVLSAANTNICKIDTPDNSISTSAAGNSGWQNLGSGTYQYNWKPLPPKGSCLSFSLNLGDGVQHIAYFQFK